MESIVNSVKDVNALKDLARYAVDAALCEGVLFRTAEQPNSSAVVQFAPFSLFPSPVPRALYHQAVTVQRDFNVLVHKIAGDGDFLRKALEKTVEVDEFTRRLWQIYETVHTEGVVQDLQLGIHRSDYMFDVGSAVDGQLGDPSEFRLIQIEINTIASAFGCLSTRLYETHRRILRRLDDTIGGGDDSGSGSGFDNRDAVPQNHVSENLAKAMLLAVEHYRQSRAARIEKTTTVAAANGCVGNKKKKLAILFLDTEVVRNIFDSRLLERAIDDQLGGDQVVVIRKTLKQVETEAHLDEETKVLTVDGFEVALAYFRVGYSPDNYPSELEWKGRLKVERSLAVKCPSIGYHLVTAKKIQQAIAGPEVLDRFLDDVEVKKRLSRTFTGLYPLDDTEQGRQAILKARSNPSKFVLKPQREGGANNFYCDDIPKKLDEICGGDGKEKNAYILMDRITPMEHLNVQLRPGAEIKIEKMVSELGIFGVFLAKGDKILTNEFAGHLLRTKQSFNDEGGVCAGYAGLDSPFLQ